MEVVTIGIINTFSDELHMKLITLFSQIATVVLLKRNIRVSQILADISDQSKVYS